jgi:hypothetical protein
LFHAREKLRMSILLILCNTPWTHMGKSIYRSLILDLGTSCRWALSFTPLSLYSRGKSPLLPLDRRLGGPQSRSERYGEVKILDPIGSRIPSPSVVHPVNQSLYRLSYRDSCFMLAHSSKSYTSHCCVIVLQTRIHLIDLNITVLEYLLRCQLRRFLWDYANQWDKLQWLTTNDDPVQNSRLAWELVCGVCGC